MSGGFSRPVILAAGGTGGHMFPALATAEILLARGRRVSLFTDERGAQYGAGLAGLDTVKVPSASPSRGGLIGKVRFLVDNARGGMFARRLLTGYRAGAVVGFGGYAAFPSCYMAVRLGVPLVLHEQNAYLGRANRRLAHAARAIALGFPAAAAIPPTRAAIVPVGNPVRPAFRALREQPYAPPSRSGPIRLFVMGGSQGARSFSQVIPAAVAALPAPMRQRLEISQQCRAEDLPAAEAAYRDLAVPVDLKTFFDDVPQRLGAAHLLVVRAGASTVAEISCVGRPAIYVPYPFAADDHQRANAEQIVKAGGGWMFAQSEFAAAALAARLAQVLGDPAALAAAAAAAREFGRPDAATALADLVERHILPEETATP